MKTTISAERLIEAPPDVIYHCIADYREHHRPDGFLPPAFTDMEIASGGVGAGTKLSWVVETGGRRRTVEATISEPEPGRVMIEDSPEIKTTFTVERQGLGALVRFDTIIDARSPSEYELDHLPGAINAPVLDDEQRIRVGERAQLRRRLPAGRRRDESTVAERKRHSQEGAPTAVLRHPGRRDHGEVETAVTLETQHRPDEGSREELEGDEGAHWIPGQADDRRSVDRTDRERLARLDGDAPEVEAAPSLEHRADEVALPNAHAAGCDDKIGVGGGTNQRAFDHPLVVRRAVEEDRRAAGIGHSGCQCHTIRVVDPARPERITGCDELVTGREDRDHRAPPDLDLGEPERREDSQAGRRQRARDADLVAGMRVVSRVPNVLSALDAIGHLDAAIAFAGIFDRHNGVGASGDRCACHDPRRGPRPNRRSLCRPGMRFADDAEHSGSIVRSHGEPVHRGVGEWRDVDPGHDAWVHQDPTDGIGQRDSLASGHRGTIEDPCAGIPEGQHRPLTGRASSLHR